MEEERRRHDREMELERYERMRRDEREKEDWRRMDEKERDECRRKDEKERDRLHLQIIAMMSGGRVNVPTNPRVIIKSSSRPSAPAVQIKIESLPQLIRCDMVIFLLKKVMLCPQGVEAALRLVREGGPGEARRS